MPTINELASTNTITGSDQFPVYVSGNGDARKASASTLLAYIQSAWMDPTYTRVTASPTLAGFTLTLPSTANSLFVLLTPSGTMATGTIVLPPASGAADGQEIVLYTSQEVTALSFTLNGATALNGAPTGIQAGASLTLRYDALSVAWYTTTKPSSAYEEGTWIPVPSLSVPVTGTVDFTGRYVRVGNLVTLELKIKTQAASTFTWTNVTDWFTGLPASVMPTIEDISTGGAGFVSYMGVFPGFVPACGLALDAGVYKLLLFSSPAASFTLPAGSSMRATLVYFVP